MTGKEQPTTDRRFVRAYLRLARLALGRDAIGAGAENYEFDRRTLEAATEAVRRQSAESHLAASLARGEPLETALVETVRRLMSAQRWPEARALASALGQVEGATTASRLGLAVTSLNKGWLDDAWSHLAQVSDQALARFLPVPTVDCALRLRDEAALARVQGIVGEPGTLPDDALVALAGRLLTVGQIDSARALRDEALARGTAHLDDEARRALEVLDHWLAPDVDARSSEVGELVTIGVIDYHQPDQQRASQNVGDYVQTLAMLGNLARFTDVTLTGRDGLGDVVTELQTRVRPELKIPGAPRQAQLVPVNRDFSRYDPIPENTWTIAFGWHMSSPFGIQFDFPYQPRVRPIFISFHVSRPEMLSPEALDYLRTYGPVGCRDWYTVDLLLSAGVDAFFSGCLTTTVDGVFPPTDEVARDDETVVAVIDVPPRAAARARRPVEVVSHRSHDVRLADVGEGVRAAIALLAGYQRRYHRIVTSRLHSYLPATSLGVPVKFQPRDAGDVRYEGLADLTPEDPAFAAMRDGIRELLREMFSLILAGEPEATVYARWRELTAERVDRARARHAQPVIEPARSEQTKGLVEQALSESVRSAQFTTGEVRATTAVALSVDAREVRRVAVTLESLSRRTPESIHVTLLTRGVRESTRHWFMAAFPSLPMTIIPCDGVVHRVPEGYEGPVTGLDRALVPELLADERRLVWLAAGALVLGDPHELGRLDLGGAPLAARSSKTPAWKVWRNAGTGLPWALAGELRRRTAASQPFGLHSMNTDVMVLDLDRLREDDFAAQFLPWAERYGLDGDAILLAYGGADRTELPSRWNASPIVDPIEDPSIITSAHRLAPWDDLWSSYANAVHVRVGAPPEAR